MAGRTRLVLLDAGAVFAASINRSDGPEYSRWGLPPTRPWFAVPNTPWIPRGTRVMGRDAMYYQGRALAGTLSYRVPTPCRQQPSREQPHDST